MEAELAAFVVLQALACKGDSHFLETDRDVIRCVENHKRISIGCDGNSHVVDV